MSATVAIEVRLAGGHMLSCETGAAEADAIEAALAGDALIELPAVVNVDTGSFHRTKTTTCRRQLFSPAAVASVSFSSTSSERLGL